MNLEELIHGMKTLVESLQAENAVLRNDVRNLMNNQAREIARILCEHDIRGTSPLKG